MSLYCINTEELIIKPTNSHKLWVNYWVKKVDLKLKKISRISVQLVRKYFQGEPFELLTLLCETVYSYTNELTFAR
jgi:hypothetical protein